MYAGIIKVASSNLKAGCWPCRWQTGEAKAVELAEAKRLRCGRCGDPAEVFYECEGWSPFFAEWAEGVGAESVPEAVHEGVASSPEGGEGR